MGKQVTIQDTIKISRELARKNHDAYEKYVDKFEDSSDSDKVNILWDALGWMQQYNGRSYHDCIVLAMGGTMDDINNHILKEG